MSKSKRAGGNIPRSFIISLGISAATIILLSLIGTVIAGSLDDPTRHLGLISLGVMLLSAALGGIISSGIRGEGSTGFSALVALTVVLIMLLINVLICKGRVSLAAFMNYACYFGVAVMSAFLNRKRSGRRKHRHKH